MASNIQYAPNLIEGFEQEHRALLQSYGRLVQLTTPDLFTDFQAELRNFKRMLVSHLLKEAVKLYIYLRQQFKEDPSTYRLVTAYKLEMDGIGKVAMNFIDTHVDQPVHEVDFAALDATLRDIGKVLGDRIAREESELYPLYHANY